VPHEYTVCRGESVKSRDETELREAGLTEPAEENGVEGREGRL
jgi:hypothetical protein